jgi:hypothetical protein
VIEGLSLQSDMQSETDRTDDRPRCQRCADQVPHPTNERIFACGHQRPGAVSVKVKDATKSPITSWAFEPSSNASGLHRDGVEFARRRIRERVLLLEGVLKPAERVAIQEEISELLRDAARAQSEVEKVEKAKGPASAVEERSTREARVDAALVHMLDVAVAPALARLEADLDAAPFTRDELIAALRDTGNTEIEAEAPAGESAAPLLGPLVVDASAPQSPDTERRVGELMAAQRETVGLNRGLSGTAVSGSELVPVKDERPTLADAGIDKHLADSSTPPVRQATPAPVAEPVPYQVINGVKVPLEPFKRPAYAFAAVHGYRGQREFADAARYVSDVMNGRERASESLF